MITIIGLGFVGLTTALGFAEKGFKVFGIEKDLKSFVEDRAGHDFRYAIDASKIENELGWKADENFETGILKTVSWYINKYKK